MAALKEGKHWPYILLSSIVFIVVACGLTIYVVVKHAPVEESNLFMQGYHDTDANYNDIIAAKNRFDKRYEISLNTPGISQEHTLLDYSVTTKTGEVVPNADIKVVLTLPYSSKEDITLENPSFDGKSYRFKPVTLPHPGRWNIMAKVSVGEEYRYYNLHADTRQAKFFEY